MGKQWKQCETLFWGAPKSPQIVTAWNKRHLLLGRKAMTNLDGILKSRDITLPTKVYLVKAMVFPVVVYGCESWTVKKAECWRIDTFELWCWRRLFRVPWTARRSNQSILKENEVAQSCPTLCDPVDCSPAGSSVHGILQARILEWVAISFSRESSRPRDRTWDSCIAGGFFYHLSHQGNSGSQSIGTRLGYSSLAFTLATAVQDKYKLSRRQNYILAKLLLFYLQTHMQKTLNFT